MVSYKALNTILKCSLSNRCDRVGDNNTRKTLAILKRIVSNHSDGVGKIKTHKACTAIKR